MTLDEAPWDAPHRLASLDGLDPVEAARLSGLGLRPGAVLVKVMPTPLRDPVECLVGDQLLALERRLLRSLVVERA